MRIAHRLAWARRRALGRSLDPADRAAFDRDGFVVKRDFLAPAAFARLREKVLAFEGASRAMIQGDTETRRIAVDAEAKATVPELDDLVRDPRWRNLIRYAGSSASEPLVYIQTILAGHHEGPPDPQTRLHADTFHPTVKAWLFLTDVDEADGPFSYVPGSHLLTPERLAWERAMSLKAPAGVDHLSSRGSFRIDEAQLPDLALPPPRSFPTPANTLIVADTCGFHARRPAARPSTRIELWAYGRRNPFLPWPGLDPWSIPALRDRRIAWMWHARDRLEKMIGQPWRDIGRHAPGDS
jgi:hypothetical protein